MPAIWVVALVVLTVAASTVFLTGRGQQDPSLSVPSEAPAQDGRGGRGNGGSGGNGGG